MPCSTHGRLQCTLTIGGAGSARGLNPALPRYPEVGENRDNYLIVPITPINGRGPVTTTTTADERSAGQQQAPLFSHLGPTNGEETK